MHLFYGFQDPRSGDRAYMGGSSPSSFGPPPKNVIKKMGEAAILLTKTNAITVTTYRELPSFNNY